MALLRHVSRILALSVLTSYTTGQFSGTYKYGVSLGGWLLAESWMYPIRWKQMGGETCDGICANTEWSLANKLGQARTNQVFTEHWNTWFTQEHVDQIKAANLDHVKIPLGFWVIEELVKPPAEMYAQGGWMELKRGLRQLKAAGLNVLLDMHALPGVAAKNELFAGNKTDEMHFYENANYQRALTWIVIMTAMSHLDPDFERVLGIFCLNEPHRNTTETPGLGQYYADFITTVRVVEYALGIECNVDLRPALQRMSASDNVIPGIMAAIPILPTYAGKVDPPLNISALTAVLEEYCHDSGNSSAHTNLLDPEQNTSTRESTSSSAVTTLNSSSETTSDVTLEHDSSADCEQSTHSLPLGSNISSPITMQSHQRRQDTTLRFHSRHSSVFRSRSNIDISQSKVSNQENRRSCLTTVAMPKTWQWQNDSESMAPHVLGPRAYDDHVELQMLPMNLTWTLSAQWTAMTKPKITVKFLTGTGNSGSLATNFNSSKSELMGWGDAQKYSYGKESFWTFWTFRMEDTNNTQWSYLQAVHDGILTNDPAQYFNASICEGREKKQAGDP